MNFSKILSAAEFKSSLPLSAAKSQIKSILPILMIRLNKWFDSYAVKGKEFTHYLPVNELPDFNYQCRMRLEEKGYIVSYKDSHVNIRLP